MTTRPRLTPAIADIRRAVRASLASLAPGAGPAAASRVPNEGSDAPSGPDSPHFGTLPSSAPSFGTRTEAKAHTAHPAHPSHTAHPSHPAHPAHPAPPAHPAHPVLVALSGGPDSLALAAATAFEAQRVGIRAGAVIVDHGLQQGSADAAANAARHAEALGLAPVIVVRVEVGTAGGPEAAARDARYAALSAVAEEQGAVAVLLGHTLDDQSETVLLGLARGSGAGSLKGMAAESGIYRRPLLGIRRETTEQFCLDAGLDAWNDPQNDDRRFARVRVRRTIMPVLERGLGPGVPEALARTAEQLREDADALDHFAEEIAEDLAQIVEAGIALPAKALAANPAALRQRLIRLVVQSEFHVSLSRERTLEVARLVTDWHGQGTIDLPGVRVERRGGLIVFTATDAGELTGVDPVVEH